MEVRHENHNPLVAILNSITNVSQKETVMSFVKLFKEFVSTESGKSALLASCALLGGTVTALTMQKFRPSTPKEAILSMVSVSLCCIGRQTLQHMKTEARLEFAEAELAAAKEQLAALKKRHRKHHHKATGSASTTNWDKDYCKTA